MNKFIFPILIGLLCAACQDTPKNATVNTADPNAVPAPVPAPAEEIQETAANITTGAKMFVELRSQVDAIPDKIKKENKAEIEILYNNLEGLIAKSGQMEQEIKGNAGGANALTDAPAAPVMDAAKLQQYNEALARYNKEAQAVQESIAKMMASEKQN